MLSTSNRFGSEVLTLRAIEEVCLPSRLGRPERDGNHRRRRRQARKDATPTVVTYDRDAQSQPGRRAGRRPPDADVR